MKHLLFFCLLILPFSGHSQVTFSDLKKLDSKEDFLRLCIEEGFAKNGDKSDSAFTLYGFLPDEEFVGANAWAYYWVNDWSETFKFQFTMKNDKQYAIYKRIIDDIKNSCSVYTITQGQHYDVVYYSCPGSLYSGKIGIYVHDGSGYVFNKDF